MIKTGPCYAELIRKGGWRSSSLKEILCIAKWRIWWWKPAAKVRACRQASQWRKTPGHKTAARQMSAFGGMLSFQLKGTREQALAAAARCKLFIRAKTYLYCIGEKK